VGFFGPAPRLSGVFSDRQAAGEALADELERRDEAVDLVLGVPRGGLPVARPVADRFDAALDVVVAKKVGLPGNDEFAIGAAAADGSVWLDDDLVSRHGVGEDYLDDACETAAATAREKAERYREGRPPLDPAGERVVVVDDGVATGATARACLRQVRGEDAARLVLGVPVGPPSSLADLEDEADAVVAVETPSSFSAVGQFYRDFRQVSDAEAMACLRG